MGNINHDVDIADIRLVDFELARATKTAASVARKNETKRTEMISSSPGIHIQAAVETAPVIIEANTAAPLIRFQ